MCVCVHARVYVCVVGLHVCVAVFSVFVCVHVHRFNPDRFAPEAVAKRQPNSFVPFGFGKRICPGYIFSYIEVATFLAMLLRKYSVTMVSSEPVEKMYGLVTSPKEEILFNLHPRDQ